MTNNSNANSKKPIPAHGIPVIGKLKPGGAKPRAMHLPAGTAIDKAVNPPKLLSELHAIGVTGAIQKSSSTSYVLVVKTQPSTVTNAQIQAIIAAHDPTPVVDPAVTQIDHWANLTASEKDALTLTALKKLYNVT